jgi:hypothetical protein
MVASMGATMLPFVVRETPELLPAPVTVEPATPVAVPDPEAEDVGDEELGWKTHQNSMTLR